MLAVLVALAITRGLVAQDEPRPADDDSQASGSPHAKEPALATNPPAERREPAEAATAGPDTDAARGLRRGALPSPASARMEALPSSLPRRPTPEAAPASSRIVLEPLALMPGAVTAGIAGYDTGAPRELELWRVRAGRAVRLGRAESDADARIHGPQLPLPAGGIELVATPSGVRPGETGASEPLRLAREPEGGSLAAAREDLQRPELPRWRHSSATRSSVEALPGEGIR